MADPETILDAAGRLFAERGIAGVEMKDVAAAAGCSRATLYRCFDNRTALHTAYVRREARTVGGRVATLIAAVPPEGRLLAGLVTALRLVRENPSLSSWFTDSALGARAAGESEVVQAMTAAFLRSLGAPEADLRGRWLVRVLTSLLISPGCDEDDEREMLAQFVIPVIAPAAGSGSPPARVRTSSGTD